MRRVCSPAERFGYRVLSIHEALAGLPRNSVVLTFDDGYRNFAEHELPVLQMHGFPATVFMISGLIDRSALTCMRGAANTADHAFELPRKAISFGDNLLGHWWKLRMKQTRKPRRGDH